MMKVPKKESFLLEKKEDPAVCACSWPLVGVILFFDAKSFFRCVKI